MTARRATPASDESRTARTGRLGGSAPLVAPVAVRTLDLETPLHDLRVGRADSQLPYRSLLVVARLGGDPVGTATFSLAEGGRLSRDQLGEELIGRFGAELRGTHTGGDGGSGGPSAGLPFPTVVDREREVSQAAPAVSVVVATCSNPRALERCVRSILSCDYDRFEVIVVENHPGAADTERLLASRFPEEPRLRYAEEPRRGAARARNAGLTRAKGEIVAFTDDDVIVDRNWIRASVEALGRADDIACVTGLILPLELESKSQVLLEQFAGFSKGFRRNTYRHPQSRAEIPFFPYAPGAIGSGANTVIRADVARELGGFDTDLGPGTPTTGGEDLELYIRLLCAGHAVSYEPGAVVWHQHPDGIRRLRRQIYRYGIGLGSVLAKQLIVGPERRGFLRAVPAGIRYARDPESRKNAGKPPDYPRHLVWLEWLGMLVGPAAYVLSAGRTFGRRRAALSPDERAEPTRTVRDPATISRDGSARSARTVRLFVRSDPGCAKPVLVEHPATPPGDVHPRARPSTRAIGSRANRPVLGAAATSVAAALSVALQLPVGLRMSSVLAFLCLAPGTAFLTAVRGRPEPGLILGLSLGAAAVFAQSMLWLGAWWPKVFLYALCGLCLLVLAPSLEMRRAGALVGGRARVVPRRARRALGGITRAAVMHCAVLAVALFAWAASLFGARLDRMGGLGLLQAMPPTYILAFALLLVGFAVAASSDALDPRLLGCYVLALIIVLHATTAVLYGEPRYAWVYKHLGVINLIASTGKADRTIDIYNNWPSFFAANAWLSKTSGLAPIAYAGWAQLFFNLANVVTVRFVLRGVTRNERLLWSATLFFVLGNWVGQDYLAPQAFGFILSLVVLGLWLRCGPRGVDRRPRGDRRLTRGLAALTRRLLAPRVPDDELAPPPLGPGAALLAGGTCFLAVVTSHQLSPALLILSVGCLALFRRTLRYRRRSERRGAATRSTYRPSRSGRFLIHAGPHRMPPGAAGLPAHRDDRDLPGLWLVAIMVAVEAWWIALAWPFLHAHFGLFQPSAGTSPTRELGAALPGARLTFYAPAAVMAGIAAAAVTGFVRRLRWGKRDLVPACLIGAPMLGVAFQSYGGEGPYRAYLFALPWLGFLAALACLRSPSPNRDARLSFRRLMAVTAAVGAFLLCAYFGQELANRIPADDVAAATWYEQHAPPGSLRIDLAPNAPNRLTARYPLVSLADPPTLLEQRGFAGHRLGAADIPHLKRVIQRLGRHRAYIVLSNAQEAYGRLDGLLPSGSVAGLVRALQRSNAFGLVYRRRTAWIFEYEPGGEKTSSGSRELTR